MLSAFGSKLKRNISLAPYTTFKIGGAADYFLEADSAEMLEQAIMAARTAGIPYFLLGLGANILVADAGFRGLVIRNRARGLTVDLKNAQVHAESGAVVYLDLIEHAAQAGLSGLEHYAGIPSTVGGALWQNLHFLSPPPARERTMFIGEVLKEAVILTPDNQRKTVDAAYFDFQYDYSTLHTSGDVVLSATFQLMPQDSAQIRSILEANLEWRRERHPPLATEPSAGSIFKKIEGIGAGRLIDQCGLKGHRVGGAEISPRHANIIVNRGGATAADVRELIRIAQEAVSTRFGYHLEPEIGMIGAF